MKFKGLPLLKGYATPSPIIRIMKGKRFLLNREAL